MPSLAGMSRQTTPLPNSVPILIHYSHWITPEARSIRYDAHFFLAQLPEEQTPAVEHVETIEGVWLGPVEGLQVNTSGHIPLTPPALCTVQGLASFPSVKAIWEFCKTRRMPAPTVPILTSIDRKEMLLLPGDELYTNYGGKEKDNYNNLHHSLRLILEQGRWMP